ncbi:MAG: class I SAM-dependent methyltransferase [Sphingobacteriales bacterium]|nr:MAG: class I SAM-dependent methyltransferase [Sphingobacteriales bacterium]
MSMKETKYYDNNFYAELNDGSYLSAKKILPVINELFKPASVVDIGCGTGYWVKVWNEDLGVEDVVGIEGTYMTPELYKPAKKYLLTADLKMPLKLEKKYDLVMSMEVAEHIPEDHADIFIQNLVDAGDIILFSAAIKGQLGTYHINEQMPEYWAAKFMKHNYVVVDYLRPRIWNDASIQYWYRQNALLFIKQDRLAEYPALKEAAAITDPAFLTRIHPEKYFAYVEENNQLQSIGGFIKYKLYLLKKMIKGK